MKLVIFDMAGTTLRDNHEVEACFARAARDTGLYATDERILAVQGMAKRYVFEMLWREQLGDAADVAVVETHVATSYQRFTEVLEDHYRTQPVEPTEGCLATFQWLRERNVKIALTTGFYRKVTDIILGRLGWLSGLNEQRIGTADSLIQASVTSDEVPRGRPHPDLIRRAMQLLNVADPQAVVNVGDTPSDLWSGRAAGVAHNLAVTNGTHTADQLADAPHHALLPSLAALPEYLVYCV